MYGHDTLFLYFCRRSQQEQIAAINARNAAAADAHRRLSTLHATRAVLAVAGEPMEDEVVAYAPRTRADHRTANGVSLTEVRGEAA